MIADNDGSLCTVGETSDPICMHTLYLSARNLGKFHQINQTCKRLKSYVHSFMVIKDEASAQYS